MGIKIKEILGGTLYYSGIVPFYRQLSSGRRASAFRVLVYHQIVNDRAPNSVKDIPGSISESEFKVQVEHLIRHYRLISLDEVLKFFESGSILCNSVLLTFDDGYQNLYKYAFPILKHYRVPALIFCTGEALRGGSLWCDDLMETVFTTQKPTVTIDGMTFQLRDAKGRLEVYKRLILELRSLKPVQIKEKLGKIMGALGVNLNGNSRRYLKEDEIREMQESGIEFGSHTMYHSLLSMLKDTKELEWEITESIRVLERITGKKCRAFAYPFGNENSYTDNCIKVLKDAGIKVAFTTIRGGNKFGCNPYLLHRFIVRKNSKYFFRLQVSGLLDG